MAGGTLLQAFANDDFKMRYREPYLTAGLNEKEMPKAPGIYRGFRLSTHATPLYVSVQPDPDPLLDDHLAIYRAENGYTLTIRKTGGALELSLASAAGSTVYIAIYAKYVWGSDTEASIRMYTQAEWDANPTEKNELVLLGVVDVPGSGTIDSADIHASYRTLPADKKASGEKPWHNIVRYGDLRGIMKQNTAQWTPAHKKVLPGVQVLDSTSGAAILKIDNSDGVSSGSSFALEFNAQDTALQTLFSGQADMRPINKSVRVKLRFWYKVLLNATTPADHYVKFGVGYTRWSDGAPDGEDLFELHFDTISAPQDWTLVEVEKELAVDILRIDGLSVLLNWPGAGSVYPAGQIYAKLADFQLLVEDEQVDVYGTVKEDYSAGFGRVQVFALGNPANEYDLEFGSQKTSYFYSPSVTMGAWYSYGFSPLEDPGTVSRNIYGFHAPWIMGGEGLTGAASIGEIPRFKAKYDDDSGATLLLEPQPPTLGTAPAFSRIYMGSHGEGANFWFLTNAMWKDSTGKWVQQDNDYPSFAYELPEYGTTYPYALWRYRAPYSDGGGAVDEWSKNSWKTESKLGVWRADPAGYKWEFLIGSSIRLGEDYAGASYEASLELGNVGGVPNIRLHTGTTADLSELNLANNRIVLSNPGYGAAPKLDMDTDQVQLRSTDGLYAPYLMLQDDRVILSGEDLASPAGLIVDGTGVVLRAELTPLTPSHLYLSDTDVRLTATHPLTSESPRLSLLDGNVVLAAAEGGIVPFLRLGTNGVDDTYLSGSFGGIAARLELDNGNVQLLASATGTPNLAYLDMAASKVKLSAGTTSPAADPVSPYLSLASGNVWLAAVDPTGLNHYPARLVFGSNEVELLGDDPDSLQPSALKFGTDKLVIKGEDPTASNPPLLSINNGEVLLRGAHGVVGGTVKVENGLGLLSEDDLWLGGLIMLRNYPAGYGSLDLLDYRGKNHTPASNTTAYADKIIFAWMLGTVNAGVLTLNDGYNFDATTISYPGGSYYISIDFRWDSDSTKTSVLILSASGQTRPIAFNSYNDHVEWGYWDLGGNLIGRTNTDNNGQVYIICMAGAAP